MAIYRDNPEAAKAGANHITEINKSVQNHDAGALHHILSEVNKQRDSMSLDGPRAVYNQLPPESKQAIKPIDSSGKENGFLPDHLDVSDIWEKQQPKGK